MQLDYQKELVPVLYGDAAVKVLKHRYENIRRICFSMHWHDRMEILLVRSGSLLVTVGDSGFTVKSGELAVFSPCLPHSAVSGDEGVNYDAVMFDISKFYNCTGAGNRLLVPLHDQRLQFNTFTDHAETVETVKRIVELQEKGDAGSDLMAVGEIYRLIGLLYCNALAEAPAVQPDSGRFKEVLDFINGNFCEDISSALLSRRFGYDETYFCRRFKAVTGLTPMVYIRILRLEKAKKLIKEGSSSLTDIAALCGFSELGYFSRCFKRHFGITPTEYAVKYKK